MSLFDRVAHVIHEVIEIPVAEIKQESHFVDDLACDSLDAIEVIVAVEAEFELDFDDADLEAVQTVAELVALVEKQSKVPA